MDMHIGDQNIIKFISVDLTHQIQGKEGAKRAVQVLSNLKQKCGAFFNRLAYAMEHRFAAGSWMNNQAVSKQLDADVEWLTAFLKKEGGVNSTEVALVASAVANTKQISEILKQKGESEAPTVVQIVPPFKATKKPPKHQKTNVRKCGVALSLLFAFGTWLAMRQGLLAGPFVLQGGMQGGNGQPTGSLTPAPSPSLLFDNEVTPPVHLPLHAQSTQHLSNSFFQNETLPRSLNEANISFITSEMLAQAEFEKAAQQPGVSKKPKEFGKPEEFAKLEESGEKPGSETTQENLPSDPNPDFGLNEIVEGTEKRVCPPFVDNSTYTTLQSQLRYGTFEG